MREKTQDKCLMGYSSAYPKGRERGFFSWRFLEVKVKGEQWNWRFKVREFDRIVKVAQIGLTFLCQNCATIEEVLFFRCAF